MSLVLQPLIDTMVSFVKCALSMGPQVFVDVWVVHCFVFPFTSQERYAVGKNEDFFTVCRCEVLHAYKRW